MLANQTIPRPSPHVVLGPPTPTHAACTDIATTYLVCIAVTHEAKTGDAAQGHAPAHQVYPDGWRTPCYQLTARVERLAADCVLLDLGVCTAVEAQAVVTGLVRQLRQVGYRARAGIGATGTIAQLALAGMPADAAPVTLVTPQATPAFLRALPVRSLLHLYPRGILTPATIERLQQYGLHTLGHLARLDGMRLRRQFGSAVGACLAAAAMGVDTHPLQSTPRVSCYRARLRFACVTTPECMLAVLPDFCVQVATHLQQTHQQACALHVQVQWESAARTSAQTTLRQPIIAPRQLAQGLRGLLLPLLGMSEATVARSAEHRIVALCLTVTTSTRASEQQATLWQRHRPTRAANSPVLTDIAQTLAQRHGHTVLQHAACKQPYKVFSDDGYAWQALTTAEPIRAATPAIPATRRRHTAVATTARNASVDADRDPAADVVDVPDVWRDVPQHLHWW